MGKSEPRIAIRLALPVRRGGKDPQWSVASLLAPLSTAIQSDPNSHIIMTPLNVPVPGMLYLTCSTRNGSSTSRIVGQLSVRR